MANTYSDFNQLDYNQLIFRQVDRIQIIAQSDFSTQNEKLFAFGWSIKLFRSLITDKLKDDDFKTQESEILKEREEINRDKINSPKEKYSFSKDFENHIKLFQCCMDLFGRKGLLYKNTISGIQK